MCPSGYDGTRQHTLSKQTLAFEQVAMLIATPAAFDMMLFKAQKAITWWNARGAWHKAILAHYTTEADVVIHYKSSRSASQDSSLLC